jgi:hypothetical protein
MAKIEAGEQSFFSAQHAERRETSHPAPQAGKFF